MSSVERVRLWRERNRERHNKWRREHYQKNKERIKAANKAYAKRNPEKIRAIDRAKVLAVYGLRPEDYSRMNESQASLCAICGEPETAKHRSGSVKRLAVDHDHLTGQVRGLLCSRCNGALGWYEKYSHLAVKYLIRHGLRKAAI